MRTIFLWAICLIIFTNLQAQLFILPVYINDASGNTDTLYILGDPTASTLLDSNFGEVNLNGVPYDSVFETRLTHDAFSATRIESKTQALFYECPETGSGLQGNTVMVRCKNWPLTIKWSKQHIDSVGLCINLSGISNDLGYLGTGTPQFYFGNKDSVQYGSSVLLTPYNVGLNNGASAPIYVFAIGIRGDGQVSIKEQENFVPFKIFPNPVTNQLTIQAEEYLEGTQVNTYSLTGSLLQTTTLTSKNTVLNVSNFTSGVYITDVKTQSGSKKMKWIKTE